VIKLNIQYVMIIAIAKYQGNTRCNVKTESNLVCSLKQFQ